MNVQQWREQMNALGLAQFVPERKALGELYPWSTLYMYGRSAGMQRAIGKAKRAIDKALARPVQSWAIGLSAGKDSTALALLLSDHVGGTSVRGMSIKDDLDYPGEREYVAALAGAVGMEVDIISPAISLQRWLSDNKISLVNDLHSRAAELSSHHFYALIEGYRDSNGHGGVFLGLRAAESRGRQMNRQTRGTVYRKADGETVAQPLADWRTEDVHAYLILRGFPILPPYLCIDPGQDWASVRKSWWVAGGSVAHRQSFYVWLRRWWPEQWQIAVSIDPEVSRLS